MSALLVAQDAHAEGNYALAFEIYQPVRYRLSKPCSRSRSGLWSRSRSWSGSRSRSGLWSRSGSRSMAMAWLWSF